MVKDDFWMKIGLEIHVQVMTDTKMYCRCRNDNSEENPNTRVCPICLGLPGSLPILNEKVVELAVMVGMGLNCRINQNSSFDRKNYFYPDLPKGYQITQYFFPLAQNGWVEVDNDNEQKKIRINRLHLEEDTAKMVHAGQASLLDFNRGGIPLMEIVTEPDFSSGEEAVIFLKKLRDLVRWVGASRARMQHGEMRCDANVSLWKNGEQLGEVVEVKNINSLRNVREAIDFEFVRQKKAILAGEKVVKETRGWNVITMETVSQRSKEKAHDYRYFPEPDLPGLQLAEEWIESVRRSLPVLPEAIKNRMMEEYGLDNKKAEVFLDNIEYFYFLEKVYSELVVWLKQKNVELVEEKNLGNKLAGYVLTDFKPLKEEKEIAWEKMSLTPENYAELVAMFLAKEINNQSMKKILAEMLICTDSPLEIAQKNGWLNKDNKIDLVAIVQTVVEENTKQVEDYRQGKEQLMSYFLGQVMKKTNGVADPKEARELLVKKLSV